MKLLDGFDETSENVNYMGQKNLEKGSWNHEELRIGIPGTKQMRLTGIVLSISEAAELRIVLNRFLEQHEK